LLNGKSSSDSAGGDAAKSESGTTTEPVKPADQLKQKALKKLLNF